MSERRRILLPFLEKEVTDKISYGIEHYRKGDAKIKVVDKDGNFCPTAQHQLTMKVSGKGKFKGVCNGDQTSLEVFVKPTMKLFNGELVVGVQTTEQAGDMVLKVSGKGIASASIILKSK